MLLQKHCSCSTDTPDCCPDGWGIVLEGSRFLSPTKQRYVPVEGEALEIAWGLEHTKYFTQGCDDLVVITYHKPLTKTLGNRTLDEIENSRIFRLKQRILPLYFKIYHMPGKTNSAAVAASRYPSPSNPETLDDELAMTAVIHFESNKLIGISWECLVDATKEDSTISKLLIDIQESFPDRKNEKKSPIAMYWVYRESLYVLDGVLMRSSCCTTSRSILSL